MEFVKLKVKEIWGDQAFISSQMDRVSSRLEEMNTRLVALEQVASKFSHFIIEHWIPTQAVLVDLHNATCPSCQRADAMADNGRSSSQSEWVDSTAPVPIPLSNSRSGEAPPLLSPVPSLISDSSSSSALLYFFVGARQRLQEALGLSISSTKWQAHCHPSLAEMRGKLEVMKTFQRLQKDLGMEWLCRCFRRFSWP